MCSIAIVENGSTLHVNKVLQCFCVKLQKKVDFRTFSDLKTSSGSHSEMSRTVVIYYVQRCGEMQFLGFFKLLYTACK